MKTIYSMGKGKYVTLDSYVSQDKNRGGNIFVVLLSLLLAAITGMALVGVDPTNINPQPTHQINETAHRTNH